MSGTGGKHVFDKPRNVKFVIYALYAACGLSFVADFIIHRHAEHPWESLFGFYSLYGFVGIVVLVLLSKELRKVILRREDYYDE